MANRKHTTKRQAKKQVRKTGKKPVVITRRAIRRYGPGITKGPKVAFGKKKKPTGKGKVKKKIRFVASVPRKPKKAKKAKRPRSRPLI